MLPAADNGKLSGGPLDGTYTILQMHLHWKSEHQFCVLKPEAFCENTNLEAHFVFTKDGVEDPLNTPKGLAVLGFLFLPGGFKRDVFPFIDKLDAITEAGSSVDITEDGFRPIFNVVSEAFDIAGRYAYYQGSLTTPACNQVVEWFVFTTITEISDSDVKAFKKLKDKDGNQILSNNRPTQAINEHVIKYYSSSP